MGGKIFRKILLSLITIFVLVVSLSFIWPDSESQNKKVKYVAAVMECAESSSIRAYISDAGAIEDYFNGILLTSKLNDFSGDWLFRITLTNNIAGIGTDTITIPQDALTKVILVSEMEVKIDKTTYKIPQDLDIVGILTYRFQKTDEGTYSHFLNNAGE